MYNLEIIREKILLPALAEEAGAQFDNPHRLTSRCPLPRHTGDRSSKAFTIYDNGQKWKCHSSCPSNANSGDVISFYMAWKGVDFEIAIFELAQRASLAPNEITTSANSKSYLLPAPTAPSSVWNTRGEQFISWAEFNLANFKGAQEYLEQERGLSPETWRAYRLGYNPTNLYDDPVKWGLEGKKIWLPRGIVIPGYFHGKPSYIKVRRPLPGQPLGNYIGKWTERDGLPDTKFGGPRSGVSCLFRLELLSYEPVLVLTEGEWDAMLLWEYAPFLCDVGTIGGAGTKLDTLDWLLFTRYLCVLVVHDDDKAGEKGRQYISELHTRFKRVYSIHPPAHDLTDFWKAGGDIQLWIAGHIAKVLLDTLQEIPGQSPVLDHWRMVAQIADKVATKSYPTHYINKARVT